MRIWHGLDLKTGRVNIDRIVAHSLEQTVLDHDLSLAVREVCRVRLKRRQSPASRLGERTGATPPALLLPQNATFSERCANRPMPGEEYITQSSRRISMDRLTKIAGLGRNGSRASTTSPADMAAAKPSERQSSSMRNRSPPSADASPFVQRQPRNSPVSESNTPNSRGSPFHPSPRETRRPPSTVSENCGGALLTTGRPESNDSKPIFLIQLSCIPPPTPAPATCGSAPCAAPPRPNPFSVLHKHVAPVSSSHDIPDIIWGRPPSDCIHAVPSLQIAEGSSRKS